MYGSGDCKVLVFVGYLCVYVMNSGVIFSLLVLWFDLCVVVNVMLEMYGIEWIDDWVIGGVLLVSLVVYCVVLLFFEVWVVCMCGFVFGDE